MDLIGIFQAFNIMDPKWQRQVVFIWLLTRLLRWGSLKVRWRDLISGIRSLRLLTLCMIKSPTWLITSISFLHWKDSFKEYFSGAIKESNQWMNQRLILLYDSSDLIFQQKIYLIYISNLNTVYIITFLAVLWAARSW